MGLGIGLVSIFYVFFFIVILIAVVYIGQLNVNVKKILNLLEKSHEKPTEENRT